MAGSTNRRLQFYGQARSTDLASPAHDDLRQVVEDRSGNLWIATAAGLDRFDRTTGRFVHYMHDPQDRGSLGAGRVQSTLVERNRLARDLHDAVTRTMYGVALYAEVASQLLSSGHVEQTADQANPHTTP
jgi:signal transduction histidine kinase